MKIGSGLRRLALLLSFALAGSQVPVFAENVTVTGPEGNTISVSDTSVSANGEDISGSMDEDSASLTVDGDTVTANEDSVDVNGTNVAEDDGGGGDGNGAAIVVGIVVVAVAAIGGYLWYRHSHSQKSVSVVITPHMLSEMENNGVDLSEGDLEQLASADVGVRVLF
jgi:hypothetical protein